jgi:uncharacterized membrane-anchored protein
MEENTLNQILAITGYVSAGCVVVLGILSLLYQRKTRSNVSKLLLAGFLFMLSSWAVVLIASFLPKGNMTMAVSLQSIIQTVGLIIVTVAFFIFTKNEPSR